jgi:hypothetical protein
MCSPARGLDAHGLFERQLATALGIKVGADQNVKAPSTQSAMDTRRKNMSTKEKWAARKASGPSLGRKRPRRAAAMKTIAAPQQYESASQQTQGQLGVLLCNYRMADRSTSHWILTDD